MISWAFLGGFAAVAIALGIGGYIVRKKIQGFSREIFGTKDIVSVLKKIDTQEASPKSVSGYDQFVLPKILQDFPDFNGPMAKTYAREAIRKKLSSKKNVKIHKVVFQNYLPAETEKTVLMQASAAYKENGKTVQKRYDLHYTYRIDCGDDTVATNCPNCGGALGFGVTVCPYCNSRVVNIMGNTWEFTEIAES